MCFKVILNLLVRSVQTSNKTSAEKNKVKKSNELKSIKSPLKEMHCKMFELIWIFNLVL